MDKIEYTDAELVQRAMMNLTNRGMVSRIRWGLVQDLFGVGSTQAFLICRKFNMDPDEMIKPRGREED